MPVLVVVAETARFVDVALVMVAFVATRLENVAVRAVRIFEKKFVVVASVILARVAKRSVAVAAEIVALARLIPLRLRVWIFAVPILAVAIVGDA